MKPAPPYAPASPGGLAWVEGLLLLLMLKLSLPEVLTDPFRLSNLAPETVIKIGILLVVLAELLTQRPNHIRFLLFGIVAALFMTARGLLRPDAEYFRTKIIFVDALTFCGLLCGLAWGRLRPFPNIVETSRRAAGVITLFCALTVVGLLTGVVAPAQTGPRMFTYSLFGPLSICASLLPFLTATANLRVSGRAMWTGVLIYASLFLILTTAVLSATRSLLIVGVASSIGCAGNLLRRRHFSHRVVFLVTVAGVVAIAVMFLSFQLVFLTNRTAGTVIQNEFRYQELQMMFAQLGENMFLGFGFGGRYLSYAPVLGYFVTDSPHVAVFTFWLKGGLWAFAAFVVLPLFQILRGMGNYRSRPVAFACWYGAGLYFLSAFLSGGWYFHQLFFCGAFLSLAPRLEAAQWKGGGVRRMPVRMAVGVAAIPGRRREPLVPVAGREKVAL